jgi:thymidylate kinase
MQIELIGCTGAGKTTLARQLVAAGQRQGLEVLSDDEFILRRYRLTWLPLRRVRKALVDLLSLVICVTEWRAQRRACFFICRTIWRLPVGWPRKLHLLRITLKKIGVHCILRRASAGEQIVLVDEGTMVIANNLFVHCNLGVDSDEVMAFAERVPLPDAAIYVRQRHASLLERAMRRGHKRIPSGSPSDTSRFIRHASTTFELLTRHPAVRNRVLVLDEDCELVVPPHTSSHPSLATAESLVRAGLLRDHAPSAKLEPR